MRHLIALSMALILALFLTACGKKETVFTIIQAPRGEMIGDSGTGYKLILEEPRNIDIWLKDRPEREAGYIQTKDFLQTWNTGDNSFEKNPPNALLLFKDNEPLVVELMLFSWNRNEAMFRIKVLAGTRYDAPKEEFFPFDIAKEHFPEYFKTPITIIIKQDSESLLKTITKWGK